MSPVSSVVALLMLFIIICLEAKLILQNEDAGCLGVFFVLSHTSIYLYLSV